MTLTKEEILNYANARLADAIRKAWNKPTISEAEPQPKFQHIRDELGGVPFRPRISACGVIR